MPLILLPLLLLLLLLWPDQGRDCSPKPHICLFFSPSSIATNTLYSKCTSLDSLVTSEPAREADIYFPSCRFIPCTWHQPSIPSGPPLSDWDKSVKDLGIGQNPSLGTSYTSLQSTTHWEPDPRQDSETFLFLQNIGIIQMQRGERRKERFIPSYLKFRKSSPPSQRWLARCLNLTFLSWQKFMLNKVSPPAQPPRGRSSCLFCLHYNLLYMASFQKLLHYSLCR